ncbi:MAG: N-acetylmuramoyl-L-alanine amidase [Eubacterium sp.]
MKKLLVITLVFCITIILCTNISSTINKAMLTDTKQSDSFTIVIDAGHGGKDAGAIGISGNYEKDINLPIALALHDFASVAGCSAVLVRNGDYELYKEGEQRNRSDLYNRLDFVNSIPNAVLVSIHQNHFDNPAEWGSQVWFSANTDKSKSIADSIQKSIIGHLQPNNNRQNKESDDSYYILYKATVPSVMVECGFISNERENKLLQSEEYQRDMAYSIFLGVEEEI